MPKATQDQRNRMVSKIRELRGKGRPEKAAEIQLALDEEKYFMGSDMETTPELVVPKLNASTQAWVDFALEHSDVDPEVLNDVTRNDIITMMRVNGIIDIGDDSDSDDE